MPDERPPLPTPEQESAVIDTIVQAATCGLDFPGWLAGILATAAARLGSTYALLESRPGSWESSHIRNLLIGTVGEDDAYLDQYREEGGSRG